LRRFRQCQPQKIETSAGFCADSNSREFTIGIPLDPRLDASDVDLVPDQDLRNGCSADFLENAIYRRNLRIAICTGRIDHMEEQIRGGSFFQRGMKSSHERMGQVADEADSVGQDYLPGSIQVKPPGSGVQGGKQLVGGIGPGLCQGIEQGRLAGVGVADQGHGQHLAAGARAAPHGTLASKQLQTVFEHLDPLAEQTPVGFKLGFARPTQADTALLTLQVRPTAHQAGRHVLQLRQFDLQLAFMASGALGEDVENQAGAIDNTTPQFLFQVALLGSGKFMIENGDVGAHAADRLGHLGHFSLARIERGIRAFPASLHDSHGDGTGRSRQQLKLLQAL